MDIACIVMAALAAACLLDLQPLARWLQSLAMVARVAAALACLWLVFDAARRRIPMGWPLATVAVLTVAASVARQLMLHGYLERSEEHTSELQSLMRTSYAVFCL